MRISVDYQVNEVNAMEAIDLVKKNHWKHNCEPNRIEVRPTSSLEQEFNYVKGKYEKRQLFNVYLAYEDVD